MKLRPDIQILRGLSVLLVVRLLVVLLILRVLQRSVSSRQASRCVVLFTLTHPQFACWVSFLSWRMSPDMEGSWS